MSGLNLSNKPVFGLVEASPSRFAKSSNFVINIGPGNGIFCIVRPCGNSAWGLTFTLCVYA